MKNYGSTVRQIRLSKGFSHKEIYTGILGKSFSIDFEKGLYDIKFNLMLKIHPDIIIGKKSDSPDEDKSLADSKALIPALKDFFRKHPLINPKNFRGGNYGLSIRNHTDRGLSPMPHLPGIHPHTHGG